MVVPYLLFMKSADFILGTDCLNEAENTTPISVPLGGRSIIVCPPNNCSGEYIIEHRNHITSQYEIVYRGMRKTYVTITTLSDAGYFRCSKKCNDNRAVSQNCYFELIGKL